MKLNNFIKDLIPLELLFRIKYFKKFKQNKKINIESASRRIFYLDSPHYGNVGDQAIAHAIKLFAETYFFDYTFVEIQQEELPHYLKFLKEEIRTDDIIFLTGGGNMGNIYKIYEATRRVVVESFPNNKIVIFPQTIEYSNSIFGRLSQKRSVRVYRRHRSLVMIAREDSSFQKMKSIYSSNKVLLCPDIVLFLPRLNFSQNKENVGICLRNDCERVMSNSDENLIRNIIGNYYDDVIEITTLSKIDFVYPSMREEMVVSKIHEIANCKLLVTDRLHAMLFSFLSKTPCIVFNNNNKKIEGVYEWIKTCNGVKLVHDIRDLAEVLKNNDFEYQEVGLKSQFEKIVDLIRLE